MLLIKNAVKQNINYKSYKIRPPIFPQPRDNQPIRESCSRVCHVVVENIRGRIL